MFYQTSSVESFGIQSIEIKEVDQELHSVSRIFRHAGDHRLGNEDSWFFSAYLHVVGTAGKVGTVEVCLKKFSEHGLPLVEVKRLVGEVLAVGTINMKHWYIVDGR